MSLPSPRPPEPPLPSGIEPGTVTEEFLLRRCASPDSDHIFDLGDDLIYLQLGRQPSFDLGEQLADFLVRGKKGFDLCNVLRDFYLVGHRLRPALDPDFHPVYIALRPRGCRIGVRLPEVVERLRHRGHGLVRRRVIGTPRSHDECDATGKLQSKQLRRTG